MACKAYDPLPAERVVHFLSLTTMLQFQSIILKGFGFSKVHTYLVQMISTAFQALAVIIATAGSTYIKNSRTYFMVAIYAVGIAGAVMVQKIDPEHLWARFFGFCLCVSFVGNFPMVFAMSTANFAGFTKKATVNAAVSRYAIMFLSFLLPSYSVC